MPNLQFFSKIDEGNVVPWRRITSTLHGHGIYFKDL
jgi:hypothetical protein